MSEKNKLQKVLPGDKLASIEEFVPGIGSAAVGESIVATVAGSKKADMSNRVMNVDPAKDAASAIPKVGDYIIGFVDSSSPSVAQVTIRAINDVPSSREFAGMLSMRDETRRRNSSPIKAADIIRARVLSTKNAIFHLAIDGPKCGVISTVCSNCGGPVVPLGRDRVKCPECGLVDDRLLAEELFRPNGSQATF
jgi:exosome complex component CSL4